MDSRKEHLLNTIIEEFIKTSEPVGSKRIAISSAFDVSPATIRNEMVELEKMGFITHPHTSAGRIPTEKGYKYYIQNSLKEKDLTMREKNFLEHAAQEEPARKIKNLAKGIAEVSHMGVFVAFSEDNFYYTGISNLFSHPEFYSHESVSSMSEIIDRLDDVIYKIFDTIGDDVVILLGRENPFGSECTCIITKFKDKETDGGIFGVLGPIRMDFQKNYSVVQYVKKLIHE